MKRSNRVLIVLGALVALVLVLLLVLPLAFRGRINQRVQAEVNRRLDARVEWRDAGLSFFRHFPNLTLTLDDLTAAGTGKFQGDTLASLPHLRVVLDLASVLGNVMGSGDRPIVVRAVELDRPRLRLIKLEDGSANWDITKKTAEPAPKAAGQPPAISLRRFEITDGAVAFDNRQAKLKASVAGLDQVLSGDVGRQVVGIRMRGDADTVSVNFAGIPYLNRVRVGLTADASADLARKTYTLRDTELRLNDLRLGVSGSANAAGKNLGLDLAFKAPTTDFRSILSLVPAVYAHEFRSVKTAGSAAVSGQVKGEYGDSAFPSFAVHAVVDSAAFHYPDLPLPARDIALDLSLTNPGGSADSTVVNLRRFHVRLGRNPVDATLLVRTPISDPDVDARVKGTVDLADVSRTMKLEGFDQLAGTVSADAAVRTRLSAIDRKQYDRVAASGTVDVTGLTVKGKTLPRPMSIRQASLRLAPERAELRSFQGSIGNSDMQATGSLTNLLSFVMRDDTLRGSATVRSNRFDLNEWRSGERGLEIIPVPPKIDFDLDATIGELLYDKLRMTDARGRLRIKDQRATLENFRMIALGGEIGLSGYYETSDPAKPAFDVGLKMTKVDIPSAFQAFTTVQALAPVAKYAQGTATTDLHVAGALARNMMPVLPGLSGRGTVQTSQLALKDFPPLEKIADVTKLGLLKDPTLQAVWAAFQIREGRLFVQPFDVKLGGTTMSVSGSNGLDQSLQYTLGLRVPRSLMGGAANQAIAGLISKAGAAGVDLSAAPEVGLDIKLGGTVTSPTVSVDVGSVAASAKAGAEQAVREAVTEKVDTATQRLVQEAEQRAAAIRQKAESLAAAVKREGYQQADALTAKASNPVLRAAAEPAAAELRKKADQQAAGIISEGNRQADSVVAAARRQGEKR